MSKRSNHGTFKPIARDEELGMDNVVRLAQDSHSGAQCRQRSSSGFGFVASRSVVGDENVLLSMAELLVLNSFVGAYGLIQVSMFMLVLPKKCAQLFPGEEAVGLAFMLGIAGATQLVCPVAGLLSDRMASPFGRRRPFIVIGTVTALLALTVLWFLSAYSKSLGDPDSLVSGDSFKSHISAPSRNMYIMAFAVLNLSLNVCFAAYAGLIPDFVSSEQLGEASGIMAVMNAVGAIAGVVLIGFGGVEPFSLYAIWLILCCSLTLVVVKETPQLEAPEPIGCSAVFRVYFESLEDPAFFWVWISRLLYYMGISVQVFMQFFIRDIIKVSASDAKLETAYVSLVMLACASLVAIPCGMLSDKVGRRPLIYMSCLLMAITYLGWAASNEMWEILIWSALFGFANGCFISVEFAIGCDTLPDKDEHAAQALGVWGIAGFLGSTLGPVISGPVLFIVGRTDVPDVYSHEGYLALLAIGAVLVLSSSAALTNLEHDPHDAMASVSKNSGGGNTRSAWRDI